MNQFFNESPTIERLHHGPLSEYVDFYSALLSQQGYSQGSVYKQLLLISHFSQWLERKGVEVSELDEDALQRFLRSGSRRTRGRSGDAAAVNRLLVLLRQLKAVRSKLHPAPISSQERVTAEFSRYLLQERGLSQSTVLSYVPFVDRFLSEQFKEGRVNLSRLRAADVTGFVQRQARQLNSTRAKSLVTALRSFFRHLQHRGEISTDLAACVPSVCYWSFSALPKFLPEGAVKRVLEHCERHTSAGRRDYAILLLLARLGLRACEVVNLELEHLDWDAGQIRICGKGGWSNQLPMPSDVGEALATYLHDAIYAKVDVAALRTLALPWPGGGR